MWKSVSVHIWLMHTHWPCVNTLLICFFLLVCPFWYIIHYNWDQVAPIPLPLSLLSIPISPSPSLYFHSRRWCCSLFTPPPTHHSPCFSPSLLCLCIIRSQHLFIHRGTLTGLSRRRKDRWWTTGLTRDSGKIRIGMSYTCIPKKEITPAVLMNVGRFHRTLNCQPTISNIFRAFLCCKNPLSKSDPERCTSSLHVILLCPQHYCYYFC